LKFLIGVSVGVKEHKHQAAGIGTIRYAQLTISDSRSIEEDRSGRLIQQLLNEAGHELADYLLLPNDAAKIQAEVKRLLGVDVDLLVTTGGTGLSPRDVTIEAIEPLLEKTLPGFGELFRSLSYAEVGTSALMSRALLGVAERKVVVCLPGSEGAVRLAVAKLLIPELRHLVWVASR